MDRYRIEGGRPLKGIVTVRGSKNGILPILAGVMLTKGETILHHCPSIADVHFTLEMLKQLGCHVEKQNRSIIINTNDCKNIDINSKSVQKMRSSILFMGALLGRFSKANI